MATLICQADVETAKAMCELQVVKTKKMHDGGVKIVHMHRIGDWRPADIVRCTNDLATLDTTPGEP